MHKWMFMLALLLGSSARIGQAQRSQPVIQFHAPAACPDQAFFTQRMHARLDADGVRPRAGARVDVRVELAASRAKGSVRIQQAAGSALRSLEAATCKEVVEGLALIAALAIATRPNPPSASKAGSAPAVARAGSQAPIPSESAAATPNRAGESAAATPNGAGESPAARPTGAAAAARASSSDASALAPVQAASRDARTREPASEESDAERSVPSPSPSPSPSPEDEPAAARTADEEEEAPEVDASSGSEPRLRGLLIDAGLIGIHGPAPHVRPGLQLGAAVVLARGALDWRLGFAGRLALPETASSAQGTTRFGFVAGVVELCGAAALGSVWSWHGCAVVEPGMLSASGENTRNARDYRRAWLALGAGTGFALRLGDWLAARAGAELLVPTRRDRAILAGEQVHHVPPVGLRLELGMEVRTW